MQDKRTRNLLIWGRLNGRSVRLEDVEVDDPDYTGGSRTLREPTMTTTLIIENGFYIQDDGGNRRPIDIAAISPGSFERAVDAYLQR